LPLTRLCGSPPRTENGKGNGNGNGNWIFGGLPHLSARKGFPIEQFCQEPESQQADPHSRELAEHARQVQSRTAELHRYLATLFPPAERPSLPGQALWQE
jgi:hypothetical protein